MRVVVGGGETLADGVIGQVLVAVGVGADESETDEVASLLRLDVRDAEALPDFSRDFDVDFVRDLKNSFVAVGVRVGGREREGDAESVASSEPLAVF